MNTFAETELLLKTALNFSDSSVKQIASGADIKASTLYKWKTNKQEHLSPSKADALLLYFYDNEPKALVAAAVFNYVLNICSMEKKKKFKCSLQKR